MISINKIFHYVNGAWKYDSTTSVQHNRLSIRHASLHTTTWRLKENSLTSVNYSFGSTRNWKGQRTTQKCILLHQPWKNQYQTCCTLFSTNPREQKSCSDYCVHCRHWNCQRVSWPWPLITTSEGSLESLFSRNILQI